VADAAAYAAAPDIRWHSAAHRRHASAQSRQCS
jgi:hypothetical protein